MGIFKTIQSTVYNPAFYSEVPKFSLKKVIGYYAKLALFIALLGTILSSLVFIPIILKLVKDFQKDIASIYPDGLEIKIEKGKAKSNFPDEPIKIPMSETWKKYAEPTPINIKDTPAVSSNEKENLVIVDTRAGKDPSIEEFKTMNTYAFLSEKYFIHYDKNNSVVYQSNNVLPQVTVSKDSVSKWLSYGRYLAFAFPYICFILIYVGVFSTLVYLILIALVFFVIMKLIKKNPLYSDCYKICVYASTAPIILDTLFFFSGVRIPFIFTFLILVIALVNTKNQPETEVLIQP